MWHFEDCNFAYEVLRPAFTAPDLDANLFGDNLSSSGYVFQVGTLRDMHFVQTVHCCHDH